MKNWKIGTRIIAGFGVVSCIALVLGVFAYTRVNVIDQNARRITGQSLPSVYLISQMQGMVHQSLAFVLTVPFFILVLMFIVQVSQLTVGLIVVQYSAFAGARAAAVWIPAQIGESSGLYGGNEVQNRFDWRLQPVASDFAERLTMVPGDPGVSGQWNGSEISLKFRRIRSAVVLAVAPVGPSRDLAFSSTAITPASQQALTKWWLEFRVDEPEIEPLSVEESRRLVWQSQFPQLLPAS